MTGSGDRARTGPEMPTTGETMRSLQRLWLTCLSIAALVVACRITSEEVLTPITPAEDLTPVNDLIDRDLPDLLDPEDLPPDTTDIPELEDAVLSDPDEPDRMEPDPAVEEPDIDAPDAERITWVGSIQTIFADRCVRCHRWASSYDYVLYRIENGTMEYYIDISHYIYGDERQTVLDWIHGGYPLD
ncbi:MAG: hypothetical protein JW797_11125 [Bradymonadales bacterium]|nr:hypothetical protein [Bradymonadales bacterium]